jgi:phosphoribosylformylglycinamidine synthase
VAPRIGVVVFPGSNCEYDVMQGAEAAGGTGVLLWHGDSQLGGVDAVVLPGGFAHGDYLRPGALARFSPVMEAVQDFARAGGPVVGICNGFQVLTEARLLPGALLVNATLKFHCHDVHLRVENSDSVFTHGYRAGQVIRVPVAHHDGNYFADAATLDRLEGDGRVAFRYCSHAGVPDDDANANGSARNIAGIFDEHRRVLGLMPHPEDATDALLGNTDGTGFFTGLAEALG